MAPTLAHDGLKKSKNGPSEQLQKHVKQPPSQTGLSDKKSTPLQAPFYWGQKITPTHFKKSVNKWVAATGCYPQILFFFNTWC